MLSSTVCPILRCEICASRKPPPKHHHAPLQIDITGNPLRELATIDILGWLPVTHQNKFRLVIGDYFTKWTEAYPIPNMEPALWQKFLSMNLWLVSAPPRLCQGRNFELALMKEVNCWESPRLEKHLHPQSDGMIERFNRTLLSMLSTAIEDAYILQQYWEDGQRNVFIPGKAPTLLSKSSVLWYMEPPEQTYSGSLW